MEADVALVAFLALGLMVGILRGAVRQLVALGAWLVTFVVAAYARGPVGDWIATQAHVTPDYAHMVGFALSFVVLFGIAVLMIEIRGTTVHLTQRPIVDDFVGGLLGLGVALLVAASLMIALDTYYRTGAPSGAAEIDVVHSIETALEHSAIAQALHTSLIPGLIALLGPLLPADVRALAH